MRFSYLYLIVEYRLRCRFSWKNARYVTILCISPTAPASQCQLKRSFLGSPDNSAKNQLTISQSVAHWWTPKSLI